MIAPLTAPHIPPVRATPLQKPVAILGIRSEFYPLALSNCQQYAFCAVIAAVKVLAAAL